MCNVKTYSAFLLLALVGCGTTGESGAAHQTGTETVEAEEHHHGGSDQAAARTLDDGSRLFGAELTADLQVVPLAQVLASPSQYDGQVIKTEGVIAQVCQAMGCWMELRDATSDRLVRVPMAGHSFFLPRDVAGKQATVQGTLSLRTLSDSEREHLESEGAEAATTEVQIDATSVVVRE